MPNERSNEDLSDLSNPTTITKRTMRNLLLPWLRIFILTSSLTYYTYAFRSMAVVRVVSYNVLSSHLASPSHFSTLRPEHLDAATRLSRILTKLDAQITSTNNNPPTIFCLQEVSYDWAGKFHAFFGQRGYHVITGLYGKKYNGYMGVLTAFPLDAFQVEDVDISRLSDTVTTWPKTPEGGVAQKMLGLVQKPFQLLGLLQQPESHWSLAQRRFNVLIQARLRHKATNTQFWIANYHMPCCYYAPMVMTLQADMCLRHVQRMASMTTIDGEKSGGEKTTTLPYILAGDFNIKPADSVYKLLTTGTMGKTDPSYPTPPLYDPEYDEWKPTIMESCQSAYVACTGREPDFTNYARVGEDDPFIDTLDYIFVSRRNIAVKDVLELPHRNDACGPFPNADEPSDHVMIAANLEINNDDDTSYEK